jgi:hypothetical protein
VATRLLRLVGHKEEEEEEQEEEQEAKATELPRMF